MQKRLLALLGVAVALAIISYIFESDTSVARNMRDMIFMGLVAISPASIITGFVAFLWKKKELGLWLILTPCIVVITMFWVTIVQ
jgi:hypothetical protein